MAVATRTDEVWRISAPEPVGPTVTLLDRLGARGNGVDPVIIGFDFPIGLPLAYGARTGLPDFAACLEVFGRGDWSGWYRACDRPEEVSIRRPFFPRRSCSVRRAVFLEALGFDDPRALMRRCDLRTPNRRAACMLFWTMGGNQVGKAATAGWREVLVPERGRIGLWPFDGRLDDLLARQSFIIVETYPGEVYHQLGMPRRGWSKRRQAGRKSVARRLTDWLAERHAKTSDRLLRQIGDGFGERAQGEDAFDALVGLMGMLDVIAGRRDEGLPGAAAIQRWEGWIFGQTDPQRGPDGSAPDHEGAAGRRLPP